MLAALQVSRMPPAEPPPRDSCFGSPLQFSRVHWVRPEVVVEVTYQREDKPARMATSSMTRRFRLIDQALDIDPNYALAWSWGAVARVGFGDYENAIMYCERALRLSPLDPRAFVAANAMASIHFLAGRYEEAISWAAKAFRQHHGCPLVMQTTVASYALAGPIEDAQRTCALISSFIRKAGCQVSKTACFVSETRTFRSM